MSSLSNVTPELETVGELNDLRLRYETKGYRFTLRPDASVLPPFLGSYRPDALAQKPDHNVAIEVKRNRSRLPASDLQTIRRLFEGHPDWQFNVVYLGSGKASAATIPPASPEEMRKALAEIRVLLDQGHARPAFVLAWSLLEAASHSLADAPASGPRTPGTVVQTLVMNGAIGPDVEQPLRALIGLRNRIVHGDVSAEPTKDEVERLTNVVEGILTE